jgi:alcohol dehydrogenase, propanol-preferring
MTNSWAALPFPTQKGQIGGHEGIGKIVKLGPGAEVSDVKIGDRVGIKWISGICEYSIQRIADSSPIVPGLVASCSDY